MKTKICVILIVAFAALFCTSAYFIFDHYRQDKQQAELYDSLADTVDCAADTGPVQSVSDRPICRLTEITAFGMLQMCPARR